MDDLLPTLIHYLRIFWDIFIIIYSLIGLGQISFFISESLKKHDYKSAGRLSVLFACVAFLSWIIFPWKYLNIDHLSISNVFPHIADVSIGGSYSAFALMTGRIIAAILLAVFIFFAVRYIMNAVKTKDKVLVIGISIFTLIFSVFAIILLIGILQLFAAFADNAAAGESVTLSNAFGLLSFTAIWLACVFVIGRAFKKALDSNTTRNWIIWAALFLGCLPLLCYVSWTIIPIP